MIVLEKFVFALVSVENPGRMPKFCHGLKCMFMAVLALKTVEYATSQEKARRMCNIISHQIGIIHQ